MIIDKLRKADVNTEGVESKKMQIDTASISILQHILSEGLYESPIEATVTELSNNAIDSVTTSGKDPVDHPIIVSTYMENDNYFFSVKDEGTGVNEEEFENIIGFYLKSTKRNDPSAIGFFGLN